MKTIVTWSGFDGKHSREFNSMADAETYARCAGIITFCSFNTRNKSDEAAWFIPGTSARIVYDPRACKELPYKTYVRGAVQACFAGLTQAKQYLDWQGLHQDKWVST